MLAETCANEGQPAYLPSLAPDRLCSRATGYTARRKNLNDCGRSHAESKFTEVSSFPVVSHKCHVNLHIPLVKLKLNTMLKSSSRYVELFPDDFRPEKVLDPSTRNLARYRLISEFEAVGSDSEMIWGELEILR